MRKKEEKNGSESKWSGNGPIIESQVKTSNDGRWVIHRTVITDIRSASYMEKVLATAAEKEEESEQDSPSRALEVGA